MEIKNVSDVVSILHNKGILYAICPYVYGGKIGRNKVVKIDGLYKYRTSLDVIVKGKNDQFSIFKIPYAYGLPNNIDIKSEDEINTTARIFTSEDEAKEALTESLRIISYKALESVNAVLKKISVDKKKLKEKEDKFKALKQSYYEMSLSKFSK